MKQIESFQIAALVFERRSGMALGGPFHQHRNNAASDKGAFSWNGDQPIESPATHRFDLAELRAALGYFSVYVGGASDPRSEPRKFVMFNAIEFEPARPVGPQRLGVGRNDLQIVGVAETDQRIVGGHTLMLAARLKSHTKNRFNPSYTDCQHWCRNNKVVQLAAWTFDHLANTLIDTFAQALPTLRDDR